MKVFITLLETNFERTFKARVEHEKQKLTEVLQKLLIVNETLTHVGDVVKVTEKFGFEVPTALLEDWINGVRKEAQKIELHDKESTSLSILEDIVCKEAKTIKTVIVEKILDKLNDMFSSRNSSISQSVAQASASDWSEMCSGESKRSVKTSANGTDFDDFDSESDELIDLENESLLNCEIDQIGQYDISVPAHASKPSCHNGSLFLPNGHMVFIDKENQLIKVVTDTFQVKCYKLLDDAPLDVCLLKNNKIAVATESSVTILDVDSSLEKPMLLSMAETVRSLCPLKNGVWMLCSKTDWDSGEGFHIIIADSKFKTIGRRDSFKTFYGMNTTLEDAKLIRSRNTNEFIICTPTEVKMYKLCGKERWYFKPSGLRNAAYIAFDVQNNLYVADIASGTIYQMSSDSYRNYRTLIRGILRPASILFNPNEQTLVIGCAREDMVYEYHFTNTRNHSLLTHGPPV